MSEKIYTLKLNSSCKCQDFLELTGTKEEITNVLMSDNGFTHKCQKCGLLTTSRIHIDKLSPYSRLSLVDVSKQKIKWLDYYKRKNDDDKAFVSVLSQDEEYFHLIEMDKYSIKKGFFYNDNVKFYKLNDNLIQFFVSEVTRLFQVNNIVSFLDSNKKKKEDIEDLNWSFRDLGFNSEVIIKEANKERKETCNIKITVLPNIAIYFQFVKHYNSFALKSVWGQPEEISFSTRR